jgi:hypothetical protein
MGSSAQAVLGARAAARTRSPFYVIYSVVLLAIVVTGFAPTFFLDAFMAKRVLPVHVIVHGIVGTSWYVLLVAQSALAYRRRIGTHRRIGAAGLWVAFGMLALTALAAVLVFPIRLAAGVPLAAIEQELHMARPAQMVRDIGAVMAFAGYIYLALRWRRDVETHKRLMLLGSVILSSAAIGRLGWVAPGLVPPPVLPLIVLLPLLAALFANDVATLGKVHRATAWGSGALVAVFVLLSAAVPALIG